FVVGVLRIDRKRNAAASRGAVIGDMAQNDWCNTKPRHFGEGCSPQVMRRPGWKAETISDIRPPDDVPDIDRRCRGKYCPILPRVIHCFLDDLKSEIGERRDMGVTILGAAPRQAPFTPPQVQLGWQHAADFTDALRCDQA